MENNETHVFLKQNYYFPNGSPSMIAFFDYRFTRMSSMVFHDISINHLSLLNFWDYYIHRHGSHVIEHISYIDIS
jgi:hypothetical protein